MARSHTRWSALRRLKVRAFWHEVLALKKEVGECAQVLFGSARRRRRRVGGCRLWPRDALQLHPRPIDPPHHRFSSRAVPSLTISGVQFCAVASTSRPSPPSDPAHHLPRRPHYHRVLEASLGPVVARRIKVQRVKRCASFPVVDGHARLVQPLRCVAHCPLLDLGKARVRKISSTQSLGHAMLVKTAVPPGSKVAYSVSFNSAGSP